MKQIVKEFRVEITVFIVSIVGILLLFDLLGVRTTLLSIINTISFYFDQLSAGIERALSDFVSNISTSDLIALGLLVLANIVVVLRVRWRYQRSDFYEGCQCPKCGSDLIRIRRLRYDRVLSKVLFIPYHRYRCSRKCGWAGLRKPGRKNREMEDSISSLVMSE